MLSKDAIVECKLVVHKWTQNPSFYEIIASCCTFMDIQETYRKVELFNIDSTRYYIFSKCCLVPRKRLLQKIILQNVYLLVKIVCPRRVRN